MRSNKYSLASRHSYFIPVEAGENAPGTPILCQAALRLAVDGRMDMTYEFTVTPPSAEIVDRIVECDRQGTVLDRDASAKPASS